MSWYRPVMLGVLSLNGFIAVWVEALFLPLYIDDMAVPVSIAVAALGNYLLMWAASMIVPRGPAPFLPVIAWAVGMVILLGGGPGGDVVLWPSWQTVTFCMAGLASAFIFMAFRPIPIQPTA